jgi:hypothetical protein
MRFYQNCNVSGWVCYDLEITILMKLFSTWNSETINYTFNVHLPSTENLNFLIENGNLEEMTQTLTNYSKISRFENLAEGNL